MCAVTGIQQNIKDQERERESDGWSERGGREGASETEKHTKQPQSVSIHACTCLYIDLFPQVLLETRSRGIALSGTLA